MKPDGKNLADLSAREALESFGAGTVSCLAYTEASLARIDEREERVKAWACLDRDRSLAQARLADERRASGLPGQLRLNGIPIGVKDIIDTRDMPTENGTSIHRGRLPSHDAAVVERLKRSGGIVLGKTVTAELAVYTPGKTTNPHDPSRTPGGSSSGSAAAVGAGMVPLAIGTQTNGSIIRPASYCGVVGFKPTFGTIPRCGVLRQAPSLDQIGLFSRTVDDCMLLASVLMGRHPRYADTLPWPTPPAHLEETAAAAPRFAFAKTPVWSDADPAARQLLLDWLAASGLNVVELEFDPVCSKAVTCHRTLMLAEMAFHYRSLYREHRNQISHKLLGMLEEGMAITLDRFLDAKHLAEIITGTVDEPLGAFDGVITPATPGEAPSGLDSTGSPVFSTLWSLCGVPAISLPLLRTAAGMPLGVQVVGARGTDARLLHAARWLERHCRSCRNDTQKDSE